MPIDFIKVDTTVTTAKFAGNLERLVKTVRSALDDLDQIKGVMDHNTDGVTYTAIETLFGLPVGQGQTTYNLVTGARAALRGISLSADALMLIDRVG